MKKFFQPGDEWLYYKIYTGPARCEGLLRHEIPILLEQCREHGLIRNFFFVRYADPEVHLRLRLQLTQSRHMSAVNGILTALLDPYVNSKEIWNVSIDCYERETGRYNGELIPHIEDLFCLDSNLTLDVIAFSGSHDISKWVLDLYIIKALIEVFFPDKKRQLHFVEGVVSGYLTEYPNRDSVKFLLDRKYRSKVTEINQFPHKNYLRESKHWLALTQQIKKVVTQYEAMNKTVSFYSLISSILHMHINRTFIVEQRKFDLLLYYFLSKHLLTEIKRQTHA